MPRLGDDMETHQIGGNFTFSGARIANLGATEYTLATIMVDITGSVTGHEAALRDMLVAAVEACQKSPRSDNLLLRVCEFSTSHRNGVREVHGFKPLAEIDASAYPAFKVGGSTPLCDACYSAVGATNAYGKQLSDQDFLANAITFVITDGEENASTATPAMVKDEVAKSVSGEVLESHTSVLIGINTGSSSAAALAAFQRDAGITQFIDAGDVTKAASWRSLPPSCRGRCRVPARRLEPAEPARISQQLYETEVSQKVLGGLGSFVMKFSADCSFHVGSQHLRSGLPCQDYAACGDCGYGAFAVVSDGCSSGGRTDVGARLEVLSWVRALRDGFLSSSRTPAFLGVELGLTWKDLLATRVTAVSTDRRTVIRIAGDGVVAFQPVGGDVVVMIRAEWTNNMPLYPAYEVHGITEFVQAQGGLDAEAFKTERRCTRTRQKGDNCLSPAPTGRRKKAPGRGLWLILIFVMGAQICFKASAVAGVGTLQQETQASAKAGLHRVPLRISVVDGSNKIQHATSSKNLTQFQDIQYTTVGNWMSEGGPSKQFKIGMKVGAHDAGLVVGRSLRQLAVYWNKECRQVNARNESAGITPIDNIQPDDDWFIYSEFGVGCLSVSGSEPNGFQPQPRSMSREKFITSEPYGFVGDAPQFFSRNPQSSGENCKDDCENASYRFAMLVQKMKKSDQAEQKRSGEGSAFLIFGTICAIAGIGSYWMARYQG